MRDAAVQAGLITSAPGDRDRVSFISEGEASLNFCIDKDLINDSIQVWVPPGSVIEKKAHEPWQQGHGVTIVDAGGGTLDVSTYAKKAGSSTEYEEITVSQCGLVSYPLLFSFSLHEQHTSMVLFLLLVPQQGISRVIILYSVGIIAAHSIY